MVEFTANYGLFKPDFNASAWHQEVNENFDSIDALIFSVIGLGNFVGVWTNSTNYTAQQRVFDPDDGGIWNCALDHTSSPAGTFADHRLQNPTHWTSVSTIPIIRGAWANDTQYGAGDIVYDTTESLFTIANTTHVSLSAPDTLRDDLANWNVIADLSALGIAVSSVNSLTGAVVLDSDDILDTTQAHKFVTASEKASISTSAADIATHETRIDAAEINITALQGVDVTLDTRLDTAESDINALEAIVTAQGVTQDAMKVLASGALSAQAALDIALDAFPTFKTFKLYLRQVVPANDNVVPFLRISDDGGASFEADAADYRWVFRESEQAVAANTNDVGDGSDNEIALSNGVGNAAGEFCDFEVTISNPANVALRTQFWWQGFMTKADGTVYHIVGSGGVLVAAVSTDVRFLFSAGNITSGSYTLVGIK